MMMRKHLQSIAVLFSLVGVALNANAFELTHNEGNITLAKTPERIATYDLAVLDSLNALGIQAVGVPQSSYAGTLADFQGTTTIGTLFEPDYPALKAVKPELIFAGGRSQNAIPKLETIAPVATFNTDATDFMASTRHNNLALAHAFDKTEKAEALLQQIEANVDTLAKANNGKTAIVLFTINGNIMAHAQGDRFGYAYELTGTTSVLEGGDATGMPATRPEPGSPEAKALQAEREKTLEKIANANPHWLLVLDRGAINDGEKTAKATLAQHKALSQTEAFKNHRVIYLEPNPWYVVTGGLANLKHITDELVEQMQ